MRLDDVHCRGFEGHQHRLTWLEAKFLFMMLRHGLRTAERIALRWHQVDLKAGYLDVLGRSAGTTPNIHCAARNYASCGNSSVPIPNLPHCDSDRKSEFSETECGILS